jgi:hypothetical protein
VISGDDGKATEVDAIVVRTAEIRALGIKTFMFTGVKTSFFMKLSWLLGVCVSKSIAFTPLT